MRKSSEPRTGMKGASRILDKHNNTVRRYVETGALPCERDSSGRRTFLVSDLAAFLMLKKKKART